VPIDREETLKKAEKLLRQGRIDAAIAEYVRVVEDQPRDWTTTNVLGDLYVRAGQLEKAAAQYSRIADHFVREGFYPKAAALLKKIIKIKPDDEKSQLQLGEISARQGLIADARAQFVAVIERRRTRGDYRGANEIVIRMGTLDPTDFEARLAAARVMADSGQTGEAATRFRQIADDLFEKGREEEALGALREAVRWNPGDVAGRTQLARASLAVNDIAAARQYLDLETAGNDPSLLLALAEIELRDEHSDEARELVRRVLELDPSRAESVVNLGWAFVQMQPMAAFMCIDAATDVNIAAGDFESAAAVLQEYVTRASTQVPALLKLVEICVDGGLEATMYDAQAQLCDAYLTGGQAPEARVIAEDLVAREPWERAHIERFRQALVMLRVPDPDAVIAERLSGQSPFVATDHFAPAGAAAEPMPLATPPAPAAAPARAADAPRPPSPPAPPAPAAPAHKGAAPAKAATEIDLTAALLDTKGGQARGAAPARQSLGDVFKDMRDQSGRQEERDDAAEQLKLARTYLEMGMADDAARALQTAARSPRHRFEAASALARLYKQRNDAPRAVEWFERAAEAPAPTAEEGRALLYDLGVTLESIGETARALAVLLELQADAGKYKDVQARIDRLSRVQTGG
jgi:tetratricopeptide (TPR) repeat protein